MNIDKYQKFTRTTAIYPKDQALPYLLLGLNEEAGEVAGKYKKYLRDGTFVVKLHTDIVKELGDVMWYAARIADEIGVDMSMVLEANKIKLTKRVETGTIGGSGDDRQDDVKPPLAHVREAYERTVDEFAAKIAHIEQRLIGEGPRVTEMLFEASITTGINNKDEAQRSAKGRCKELGHEVVMQTEAVTENKIVVTTVIRVPVEDWKYLQGDESFMTHWTLRDLH